MKVADFRKYLFKIKETQWGRYPCESFFMLNF